MLESALEQALSGRGQVIGVVGEAGVGKSRLCHEFAERQRMKGVPGYHVAGQAHMKSVPLLPVLELLRVYFGIGESIPTRRRASGSPGDSRCSTTASPATFP